MMSQASHQRVMVKKELTKKLQARMYAHFFEHGTHTVNDSLASILALCDIEQMQTVPRIKQYINHINQTLNSLKVYHNENRFNIDDVLKNVIGIVEDEFKGVSIIKQLSESKALSESNQALTESILLYILIELITSKKQEDQNNDLGKIYINLHQKDKDAQIVIKNDSCIFSEEVLKEIDILKEDFQGKIYIVQKNNGISIDIRMPLSFNKPKEPLFSVNKPSIKVKSIQPIILSNIKKVKKYLNI